jgi:hypothetical protein
MKYLFIKPSTSKRPQNGIMRPFEDISHGIKGLTTLVGEAI